MLGKPQYGWSDFQLEHTSIYSLSYLDDIAFEWVEQAIHGLESMRPFCVKGFLEPNRLLCVVSYWNCHIICENEERYPLEKEDVVSECSHTSMLQFCKCLWEDIGKNVEEWASFPAVEDMDIRKRQKQLLKKLEKLRGLIDEKAAWFDEGKGFL